MRATPLLTILLLGCLSTTASAQPDAGTAAEADPVRLPDYRVTARKRVESEIDVPESVTVVPGSLVRDAGIRNVAEAGLLVPNLNFVEFSARRLSFPFVRGIGSGQGEPAVATYVDGVPLLHGSLTNLPLLNVERIEFLRGPQGTLFGRNALGGLIHVFTRPPPAEAEARADATAGSRGLREARVVLGAPIVPGRLALSLAGLDHRREGFTRNDLTGRSVDDRSTLFGQGQALLTPDDENEFRLSILAERSRDGGFALSDLEGLRDRPRRISQDFEGVTERDVTVASLSWRHRGDAVDVVSITSFEGFDVLETADFDFTALDGVRRRTEEESRSLLQEIRLSSATGSPASLGDGATLDWLVGALAFASDSERSAANEFRPGAVGVFVPFPGTDETSGEFRDRGIGLFGQATVTLLLDLQLGAGLRYDLEQKEADLERTFTPAGGTGTAASRDLRETHGEWLPRFDAGWRLAEEVRVYGSVARGSKAGGFNLDAPEGSLSFGPERSWTFEAGVKALLLDGRLRIAAAVFRIDWDDMQLNQFDATAGGYVTNAGESTSRGFEIEVEARPVEGLVLGASFGATDTEFDSYVDPFGTDVGGNDLPFAPETTFGLSAQWNGRLGDDLRYLVRGEYAHVGTFHYDAGNRESESFGVANFRVALGAGHWGIEAFVENAFDAEYVPVAFQPNPADPAAFVGESGAPRTYGLTVRIEF